MNHPPSVESKESVPYRTNSFPPIYYSVSPEDVDEAFASPQVRYLYYSQSMKDSQRQPTCVITSMHLNDRSSY